MDIYTLPLLIEKILTRAQNFFAQNRLVVGRLGGSKMERLTVKEIVEASKGNLKNGEGGESVKAIVIDSRLAKEDTAFVAIVGENNDAHKYIGSAYDLGCRVFIVNKGKDIDIKSDMNIIEVDDTSKALGDIGHYYKKKFDIPFIGITGSVGKTTTRDMVYAALSSERATLKNEKNFNNHFGVPLTLFNLDSSYECAVIEMGMSGFGEIEYLANMVNPKVAVISNIGLSHVENLGSQEGIFKAKMEITTGFGKGNTLVVNGDDKFLSTLRDAERDYDLITFGFEKNNDIYCVAYDMTEDSIEFECSVMGNIEKIFIPTVGKHNIYNAMAAIAVGTVEGISMEGIKRGLSNFEATGMRQDIRKIGEYTVINDTYNASPDSMEASLSILGRYEGRRIAVLGDMLEMGDLAEFGHRRVGKACVDNSDVIITVGESAVFINKEAEENGFDVKNSYHFDNLEDAKKLLGEIMQSGDTMLFKASRGMKFEKFVEYVKEVSEIN